jgi:hypothetical protein
LGSFHKAEIASDAAVREAVDNMVASQGELDFVRLFESIQNALKGLQVDQAEVEGPSLGTTLICLIETKDRYRIAYVGNGAVFHIRGDFNHFSERVFLPWNAINLLNPHTREEGGKNAMYKLLSPSAKPQQIRPQIIEISKDEMGPGEILMVCTDGIYSADEVAVGKDSEGNIWISGEESMALFYQHLDAFFKANSKDLQATLQSYLLTLEDRQLISDDCTLGVIISPQALKYQQTNLK